MNVSFKAIEKKLDMFLCDDDLAFYTEKSLIFARKHINEDMTEDEAISYLETNYLFTDEYKSKPDILSAADIIRAIRMLKFERKENCL